MKKSTRMKFMVVGLTMLLVCFVFTSISLGQQVSTTGSRLVVFADDWTLGNFFSFSSNQGVLFAENVFSWLTEYASPEVKNKILIDEAYADQDVSGQNLTGLISTLTGLGFSVDIIHPSEWTPSLLAGYGAVLLERGQPFTNDDSTIVKSYILNGGGAIIVGGGLPENLTNHNNIINPFGLQVNTWTSITQLPGGPNGEYILTSFVPHSITDGISSLWTMNPTPIVLALDELEFNQAPMILCTQQPDDPDKWPQDVNWLAVWERIGVTIDIKPGSDPNCFKINGQGVIPVAILGSANFDVYNIDPDTLIFGGLTVRVRGNKGPLCHIEDTNNDSFLDLVCQFEDDATAWIAGDSTATLTGNLLDGSAIEGTDSICIVPPE